MQLTKHFFLQDFIPKQAFDDLMRLARICDWIADETKLKVVINNWAYGGNLNNRGLRLPYTNVGSPTSEHRNLRAVDINIGSWTGARMFNWAQQNAAKLYELGVRRIEHPDHTPTWLHLDMREHGKRCIQIITPTAVVGEIKI